MCVCVCVCVRERERDREREGGGGRKNLCVCEFCVICWYQYFRQKYVLEEEGAKPEKSRPSQLFTLQPTQTYAIHSHSHLSLSHQIHTFSRFHYKPCSYGHPDRNR